MFVNTIGGRIDLSNFHRDVSKHAVAATFPTGPLRHVRRQDLRHAAITLWLNSGVPPSGSPAGFAGSRGAPTRPHRTRAHRRGAVDRYD